MRLLTCMNDFYRQTWKQRYTAYTVIPHSYNNYNSLQASHLPHSSWQLSSWSVTSRSIKYKYCAASWSCECQAPVPGFNLWPKILRSVSQFSDADGHRQHCFHVDQQSLSLHILAWNFALLLCKEARMATWLIRLTCNTCPELECGPVPNVMAALPNIGGALCSAPQSLADAHY